MWRRLLALVVERELLPELLQAAVRSCRGSRRRCRPGEQGGSGDRADPDAEHASEPFQTRSLVLV
jgi:hypothetical protein